MDLSLNWPLMANNITRQDLDTLIDYLSQEQPRLTQGDNVEQFGDLAASRLFAPAGARTALEWCRVTSNYVNPPPLSVPIHPT